MPRSSSRPAGWRTIRQTGIALALMTMATMVTMPGWFPWLLGPMLRAQGVRYDHYERLGFLRFALTGLHGGANGVEFAAQRVECALPPVWLWHRFRGSGGNAPSPPLLTIADWQLRLVAVRADDRSHPGSLSTARVLDRVTSVTAMLGAWLPEVRLTRGSITAYEREFRVLAAAWRRGACSARILPVDLTQELNVACDFSNTGSPVLTLGVASLGLVVTTRLTSKGTQWDLHGEMQSEQNRVTVAAHFDPEDRWPAHARLQASRFTVPSRLLKVEGYKDATGTLAARWDAGRFEVATSVSVLPMVDGSPLRPPLEFEARATGDAETARLEQLTVRAPGFEGRLSDAVMVSRAAGLLDDTITLRLAGNLGEGLVAGLAGRLEGSLRIKPAGTNPPRVEFQLAGTELRARKVAVEQLEIGGFLAWPRLVLETATVVFADGSRFAGKAGFDLSSRQVTNGQWRFQGGGARFFLPAGWSYRGLNASGEFIGPLSNVAHAGTMELSDASIPHSRPLRVLAKWTGVGRELTLTEATIASARSTLRFAGEGQIGMPPDYSSVFRFTSLSFLRDSESFLTLQHPSELKFRFPGAEGGDPSIPWYVSLENLRCTGAKRRVVLEATLDWPHRGRASVELAGLNSEDFADFLAGSPTTWTLDELRGRAEWNDGPVAFDFGTRVGLHGLYGRRFSARANVIGRDGGVTLEKADVSMDDVMVFSAGGRIPLTLVPGAAKNWLQLDREGSLHFQALTDPNPEWWKLAATWTGVEMEIARVQLDVLGSLREPRAHLSGRAARLAWSALPAPWAWLSARKVEIEADVRREGLVLTRGRFEVEGQPIELTGSFPLPQGIWSGDFSGNTGIDWARAAAQVRMADHALAPWAARVPNLLEPAGRLGAEVTLEPGLRLVGDLRVAGATTRPIATLGSVRDLNIHVKLGGHRATLESLSASVAGRAVTAAGEMTFTDWRQPRWRVTVRAEDLPLVRQAGLVVRANVDLTCLRTNETPVLTGELRLRDSLYLRELSLLPSRTLPAAPRHAPRFRITQSPFAAWKLDLSVRGDRFLRINSPVLRGELSTAIHLTGTLGDPRASGEAHLDSGWVQFPFGNLRVEQGLASVTAAKPDHPQLQLTAASRNFGYDVRMELSGTLEEPMAVFSATPPLRSEEIVMMLTTGEPPSRRTTTSTTQRAGRFAAFLGQDWLRRLGVGQEDSQRLTIRSGEEVSSRGGLTYSVEYRLDDDWSLVAEYDRFNAFNAGVKWRLYSK